MTIHIHELGGCAPAPLAHYLKALGILRLVSEQADAEARGWWGGDQFRLTTSLSRIDLNDFFLHEYRATPIISPWNKGSGFFHTQDPAMHPLETSPSPRFAAFREGIKAGRALSDEIALADRVIRNIKEETKVPGMSKAGKERLKNSDDYKSRLREAEKKFKQLKANLIPNLRLSWRNAEREWLDAAMVLGSDGEPSYPALLGSGGNDGRLDFTNNFMKRLGEVFDLDSESGGPQPHTAAWFAGALWGTPITGCVAKQPVGQYLPGTVGGANNANGPNSDSILNPVDFILALEGTIAFTSHATRRLGLSVSARAASPFATSSSAAAYASAAADDGSARGEQWMPLWSKPSSYPELQRLLAEGRAQLGTTTVREPLDFARAVKRLGVARGIRAFQRYGYIERNGQSNLAVPLVRFDVVEAPVEHIACIEDLDLWLRRLRRKADDRNAPARLIQAAKNLEDSLIAATELPHLPDRWQWILKCLADIEKIMPQGGDLDAGPIPKLRPDWITAAYDDSSDFRLALAFALQTGPCDWDHVAAPIRRHWLPLARDADVVMQGRDGLRDAIALVQRRVIEGAQRSHRHLPLMSEPGASASASDLSELLAERVDLNRINALARAFMALDRKQWRRAPIRLSSPELDHWPDEAWLAIRLCTLPWKLKTHSGFVLDIGTDPAIVRRLAADDAESAITIALRRLAAAGVRCTIRAGTAAPNIARLWAAALAFPISERTAARFLEYLDPSKRSSHVH